MKKAVGFIILTILILFLGFKVVFINRVYPRVRVAGTDLSGYASHEALNILKRKTNFDINLFWGTSRFTIKDTSEVWQYQPEETLKKVLITQNLREVNLPLSFHLTQNILAEKIASIAAQINLPAAEPQIYIDWGKIVITPGENGQLVDEDLLIENIKTKIAMHDKAPLEIPVKQIEPKLTLKQMETLKARAEKLLGKHFTLRFEGNSWTINQELFISWLDANGWKEPLITAWVSDLAENVDRAPQNAYFRFVGTGRVEEFKTAKPGIVTKQNLLVKNIIDQSNLIEAGEQPPDLAIPVLEIPPEINTGNVNNLGIKEIVGAGYSDFSGSIPNRVYNVGHASEQLNGILVAPGDTFSFNKVIGDISAATGYKQAYVIKEGRTVLGDGGGVCQVSSTLFRAILDAGLPVEERWAHAYRVHYYENDSQPGFDATVYGPTIDLRFKNDTGNHILIETIFSKPTNKLTVNLYGTRDGRKVTIGKPRVWDVTPPPPALYQDDPSLARGVVQQVDWSAQGTKAAFDWKVTRGDEVLQERTFYSNYRPWQAVYLKGTR